MEKAARKASRHFARDFGEVENLQVSRKGPADFVSAADLKAERILREELLHARPNHGFVGEEDEEVKSQDGGRWIVDPLDGTTNFIHGLPHFAVSIALERDGALAAGVVYQPLTDELFWASKGGGAYLNNRRLRVAARTDMADCLFATGAPFLGHGDHPRFLRQLEAVMARSAGVRRFGAAALDLVYVAAGKFDGFWEGGLKSWDIAAGGLIAQEAGALVTDFDGGGDWLSKGDVVAAPPAMHEALRKIAADA